MTSEKKEPQKIVIDLPCVNISIKLSEPEKKEK